MCGCVAGAGASGGFGVPGMCRDGEWMLLKTIGDVQLASGELEFANKMVKALQIKLTKPER